MHQPVFKVLQFNEFALDLARGCLRSGCREIELRPKAFAVLRHLAENGGRLVPKQELYEAVWPDVAVSDDSLVQCIRELREKLGDQEHQLIKTMHRRGYLLNASVAVDDTVAKPFMPGTGAATSSPRPSSHWASLSEPRSIRLPIVGRWRQVFQAYQARGPRTWRATAAAGMRATARIGAALGEREPVAARASKHLSWTQKLLAVALCAVLSASVWTLRPQRHGVPPSSEPTMMAAPTIAVLPFTTAGVQDRPQPLAEGLEAEVRSELARVHRGFDLILRSATNDRERLSSPKAAGSRLGARYVVVGTTWLDGDIQRANIRLIEVETDRQIWSEPFELNRGQTSTINRMAVRIARLLVIQVRTAESRRPLPTKVEAGHYVLQARALHESERGPKSTTEAQLLFKKALQLDANSVPALQGFATTRIIQVHNAWIPWEQRSSALVEAEHTIERLVKLDPGNAAGHYLRAVLLRALGEVEKAIASAEHALSLNPNYFAAHAELGRLKIDAGLAHEAISHIQTAIELNPPEPNIHVLYFWAGLAALHISDDQAAVQWLLKARQANPAFSLSPLLLAAAYLNIGEEEQARASLAEHLKEVPSFSIWGSNRWMAPARNPIVAKQRERIRDAWRRLGVPEDGVAVSN